MPAMERKQYNTIIWLLGSLAAIGPFSIDMYLPGFPAIAADLSTDMAHVGLTLTSYFVGISIGQIAYGPLMDRFGRKKPLMLGLLVYIVAALGCALSPSVSTLIILRFFLALGGCVGMAGSRAVVRDLFSGIEIARALSALVMVFGVAPIIAPTIGGLVVKAFGWRYIFVVLAAIGAVVLIALSRFLRESKGADASISLHPKNVVVEYLRLFRDPGFVLYSFVSAAASGGFLAYISGSAFIYMKLFGFTETQFGWMYSANAVGLITASQINRLWLRRQDSARILRTVTGAQFCFVAVLFALPLNRAIGIPGFISLMFCYVFLFGFVNPNAMALALHPFERNAGSASALIGCIQMVGGASASGLVSYLYDGTAMPMIWVMAGCTGFTLLVLSGSGLFMKREPENLAADI
ncbi:MAG: Bicyclomycin resistance protein [Syntrophorhabdus sp. PtaU1.Bin153]|nr:MAG: Bicyclomycin resistance protein [Syntrophorhabdus sp. PtaU1.Bin153]